MVKSLSLVKDLHTKSYEHILNGGGFGLETQSILFLKLENFNQLD